MAPEKGPWGKEFTFTNPKDTPTPILFGCPAHRHYGLGWRHPRSGRQVQQDPGYTLRWHLLKEEAYAYGEIARLIDASGLARPREIMDAFEKGADGPSPN